MVLEKSEPHQVCMQVDAYTREFVGPSPQVPRCCIHTSGPMG